jgi:uncharacterized protein YjiS (DUF1127 family)
MQSGLSQFLTNACKRHQEQRVERAILALHADQPQSILSWSGMRAASRRHRSRQHLTQLDAHRLKDIGVSFSEAQAEANKPFWRA